MKAIISDTAASTNAEKLVFSFEHFGEKAHGLDCPPEEFRSLVSHLKTLSAMTWQQVQDSSRHGLGSETIRKDQIAEPLPSCHSDKEAVLSFRYNGMKAFVGIRSGRILDVLYMDPGFDLYRH